MAGPRRNHRWFRENQHREFSAEVFRNGNDIKAPDREEIRAVEKGSVVFSERFFWIMAEW